MITVQSKVDPRKRVEIGGYRLDTDGNTPKKAVKLSRSETYLTELMETICKCRKNFVLEQCCNVSFGIVFEQVINWMIMLKQDSRQMEP